MPNAWLFALGNQFNDSKSSKYGAVRIAHGTEAVVANKGPTHRPVSPGAQMSLTQTK